MSWLKRWEGGAGGGRGSDFWLMVRISYRCFLLSLRHFAGEYESVNFGCVRRVECTLRLECLRHENVGCAHSIIGRIVCQQEGWGLPPESLYAQEENVSAKYLTTVQYDVRLSVWTNVTRHLSLASFWCKTSRTSRQDDTTIKIYE